jgi:hypothetical protein
MPRWAPGLCDAIDQVDGRWIARSGSERMVVEFASPNPFGVLDHDVTFGNGERFHNPMRVLRDGDGAEVVFTLRHLPGVSDADFERDSATVLADLNALKRLLEND